jgi:hypothetical protein
MNRSMPIVSRAGSLYAQAESATLAGEVEDRTSVPLPANLLDSPAIATITQARDARQLQLGLRYRF